MELNTLLVNVAILACVWFGVRSLAKRARAASQKLMATPTNPGSTISGISAMPASFSPRNKRLDMQGVASMPVNQGGFVSGFGIRRDSLIDLAVYAQPGPMDSFPDDVRDCLKASYEEGRARGIDCMELVCLNGTLKEGQALYFALVYVGATAMPIIVAFVDRIRN